MIHYLKINFTGFYIKISNGCYTYVHKNMGGGKLLILYLLVCFLRVTLIEHIIVEKNPQILYMF